MKWTVTILSAAETGRSELSREKDKKGYDSAGIVASLGRQDVCQE